MVASPLGAINGNVIVDGLLAFSQSSGGAASLASSVLSVNGKRETERSGREGRRLERNGKEIINYVTGTLVINPTGVLDLPQRLSPDFYASVCSSPLPYSSF